MKSHRSILSIVTQMVLLIVVGQTGCGKDSNNPASQNDFATIEGRVTNETGLTKSLSKTAADVEGATVTVVQVQTDGTTSIVSTSEANTNASGKFEIEVDVESSKGLIVIAKKDGVEWKAVVNNEVRRGSKTKCQPHNEESTSEAEVDDDIRQRNNTNNNPRKSSHPDVAIHINAKLAAEINGDSQAIAEVATAIEAESEAHVQALSHASISATANQMQDVVNAKAEAQANFEIGLHTAIGNESSVQTEIEAFQSAIVAAYLDAGISASAYAKAKQTSSTAMMSNISLSAEAELALKQAVVDIQSWASEAACRSQFNALGAANTEITALANAATALRLSVKNASSKAEIQTALASYHDTIISQLQISAAAHASAVLAIDATINAVAGAKLSLAAAISAAVTTEAVVAAYFDFFAAVETLVSTTLSTATQTEIEAIAEILILANMSI